VRYYSICLIRVEGIEEKERGGKEERKQNKNWSASSSGVYIFPSKFQASCSK